MRAGKRNDTFPNSYTGDPLAAYRLNIAKAGWPSWNLYLDSGPTMAELAEEPPKDPEEAGHPVTEPHEDDEEEKHEETGEDEEADVDEENGPDEEASSSRRATRRARRGR